MRATGVFFAMFVLFGLCVRAQDLESLRWKNRVILLYTHSLDHPEYKKMETGLQADAAGVATRKIIIFTIVGEQVSRGLPVEIWEKLGPRAGRIPDLAEGFRLELIGLDGGLKYTTTTATSREQLWALIDGMPMRREELRTKGNP